MLLNLGLWVLIAFPAVSVGLLAVRYFDSAKSIGCLGDRLLLGLWLGLFALSVGLYALAFVMPLSLVTYAIFAAVLLLAGLSSAPVREDLYAGFRGIPSLSGITLAVLCIAVAGYTSRRITLADTELYHYQAIMWQSEYGMVPGLGLLHERFGYITSWFSLPAAFDTGGLKGRVVGLLGSLAFCLLFVQLLLSVLRLLRGHGRSADRYVLGSFAFALVQAKAGFFNSPSPDLPVMAATLLTAWVFWLSDDRQIPVLVALAAFAAKLSALPIFCVVLALWLWRAQKSEHRSASDAVLAAIVAIVSLILIGASFAVTGCFLFPAAFTCVDVPWGLGAEQARQAANTIIDFARWSGGTPEGAGQMWWLAHWVKRHIVVTSVLLGCALLLIALRHRVMKTAAAGPCLLIGSFGVAYALSTAPDPRFWAGSLFIFTGTLLALAPPIPISLPSAARVMSTMPLVLLLGYGVLLAPRLTGVTDQYQTGSFETNTNWLMPPKYGKWVESNAGGRVSYGETDTFKFEVVGNVRFNRPVEGGCGSIPLPCTSEAIRPSLSLYKPEAGYRGGFQSAGR